MRTPFGGRVLHRLWQCAAAAMIAACSDGSGPSRDDCPQTGEFANLGCARVQGVVRYADGSPVSNARVTLTPAAGVPNTFDTAMDDTDAAGAYSLEIHDLGGEGRTEPPPEPVAMNLRATVLSDSPSGPASDLVPVSVNFAPVGEVPDVLQMDITIDVSP